jgi:PTH1 family peptidyl-tRNA hydrolase
MRRSGSSGGHKGLGSIESAVGTRDYARLRVGIGRPPEGVPSETWVLARPTLEDEARALRAGITRAADAARAWLAKGVDRAMEEFNRAPPGPGDAPGQNKGDKERRE